MKPTLAALALLAASAAAAPAAAQGRVVDSYCTTISENDKFASDGYALSDAASIIRQDRANYHKFGLPDPADEGDATFGSGAARERIPDMLANGSIEPSLQREIVNGTPDICVEIHERAISVFGSMAPVQDNVSVYPEQEYPFIGQWDCEVSTLTFTPTLYNNGFEDIPILEAQEGTDGSYTLFLPGDELITLSGFTGDRMGWFSHQSGDNFNCRRLY